MRLIKFAVVLVSCLSLAACGSIGTINGVELNNGRMGATDSGPQPYCSQNAQQQWTCILIGGAIVGGAAALALSHHDHSPAAAPPPPPLEG